MKTYLFSLALLLLSASVFSQTRETPQATYHEAFTKMPEGPKYSDPPGMLSQNEQSLASVLPYPNPGNGNFFLNLTPGKSYRLQVLDLAGNIRYDHLIKGTGKIGFEVKLSEVPNGIYLVRVNEETYKYQKL